MNAFVLGDARRCIGCQACMIACARAHEGLPAPELAALGTPFVSRVTLVSLPEVTVPVQCRQCEDSPCANACPVNAIVQKDGHVDVIKERCIGCKSCVLACPFGAIQVVEDPSAQTGLVVRKGGRQIDGGGAPPHQKSLFVVSKCDLCTDLAAPACVDICPAGALSLVNPARIHDNTLEKRQRAAAGIRLCTGD